MISISYALDYQFMKRHIFWLVSFFFIFIFSHFHTFFCSFIPGKIFYDNDSTMAMVHSTRGKKTLTDISKAVVINR